MSKILEVFPDPDEVGQAEYRAIYDCIADALADTPPQQQAQLVQSMLTEFRAWAQKMLERSGLTL